MSIPLDAKAQPFVASIYHWEAERILPSILSDQTIYLCFNLVGDKERAPSVTRGVENVTPEEGTEHLRSARVYFKVYPVLGLRER